MIEGLVVVALYLMLFALWSIAGSLATIAAALQRIAEKPGGGMSTGWFQ